MPKENGGTGVVDLSVKNSALMAKWSWRYAVERDALWRKVIDAKYGSRAQQWRFWTFNKKEMSVVWRGIVEIPKT